MKTASVRCGLSVKKGLKKGRYKVKVRVRAAGDDLFSSAVKTVTVSIKVTVK